jgi:hypothetical protein
MMVIILMTLQFTGQAWMADTLFFVAAADDDNLLH